MATRVAPATAAPAVGPAPRTAMLVVGLLVAIGAALRVSLAGQSLFADELATYWIVSTNDLGGVVSTVNSDAEISPPLSFIAGWLATRIDLSAEMLRLPSLLAGLATIPVVYLLGVRTVGRGPALLAAALTTLSPFMIYYSAEARGYALMMAFVALSTLSMLLAVDRGGARWWIAYALFTCLAVYTHYTCVFVLAAQLGWVLWTHPEARRGALVSTGAAAISFLPWSVGLISDFQSPTADILAALQPFTPFRVRQSLEHWMMGYPYATLTLRELPGPLALLLLAGTLVLTAGGLVASRGRDLRPGLSEGDRRTLLVILLALALPVGAALFSAIGPTRLFSTRNLAASWPTLALTGATLILASGPRLRLVAAALTVAAFGIGAVRMLDSDHSRPQYEDASSFVDRRASPEDALIDEAAVRSPGPLSHIDPYLEQGRTTYRSRKPQQDDHPFGIFDRDVPPSEASQRAARAAAAAGGRIFLVTDRDYEDAQRPMGRFRLIERRQYPGVEDVVIRVYAQPGSAGSR